jgi:hypothetical protein
VKREFIVALCAALFVFVVWSPPSASAQDVLKSRMREARIACADDQARLCRDVPPGKGRIIACMHLNADKLSQRCFQAMTAWGLAAANAYKACLPEVERFCAHLPPAGPRQLNCMLQNADKLSKPCGDALFGEEPLNGRRPDPR